MDSKDGRRLYAVVPPWLAEFGDFPTHDARGNRNMLVIEGNMPGRADAGKIWQTRFNRFLVSYGLRRLITDRRVWVLKSALGTIIIHDHVDDSRLTSTTAAARSHFYRAWALEFNSPPESAELSKDFTGLRHHQLDALTTEISCGAVIRSLNDLVAPYTEFWSTRNHDTPLPVDGLKLLEYPPDKHNTLRPDLLPYAQKIAGAIGFIVNAVRPDAYFAYCVLAGYVNVNMLTEMAFRLLIRIGRYIAHTKDLTLTMRSVPPSKDGTRTCLDLFRANVDSSHGNAPGGRSYGGFVLTCVGGGALA